MTPEACKELTKILSRVSANGMAAAALRALRDQVLGAWKEPYPSLELVSQEYDQIVKRLERAAKLRPLVESVLTKRGRRR